MALTGLGFAACRRLLAAARRRLRRHAQPLGRRRERLPAARAGAARPQRRARRSVPRCSPATAWSARSSAPAGTLLAALPELLAARRRARRLPRSRGCSSSTRSSACVAGLIYRGCPRPTPSASDAPPSALGPSRRIVYRLAALFSLDAFAGGLVVQSLLALWLLEAFGLSLAVTAQLFFWSGLLTALSYLVAVPLARRIGLINTMVFTHLPANLCLIAVPFVPELWQVVALLLVRSLLSQMDVPTRTSYVMAVVTPAERQAAASLTAVPRSLAAAVEPEPRRLDAGQRRLRLAAAARRGPEDRLRPHAARPVPRTCARPRSSDGETAAAVCRRRAGQPSAAAAPTPRWHRPLQPLQHHPLIRPPTIAAFPVPKSGGGKSPEHLARIALFSRSGQPVRQRGPCRAPPPPRSPAILTRARSSPPARREAARRLGISVDERYGNQPSACDLDEPGPVRVAARPRRPLRASRPV